MGSTDEKKVIKQGQDERWRDSRKFIVTVIALVLIGISVVVGLLKGFVNETNFSGILTSIAGIVGGYVIGQGYADGQATNK